MKLDPFTLRVALDKNGAAEGDLYLDDGETFSHEKGEFVWRSFKAETKGKTIKISNRDKASNNLSAAVDGVTLDKYDGANTFAKTIESVRVEKIVLMGLPGVPTRVDGPAEVQTEYVPGVASTTKEDGPYSVLIIKNPVSSIAKDWEIVIQAIRNLAPALISLYPRKVSTCKS